MNEAETRTKICAYCRASTPITEANGLMVKYESTCKTDIAVSPHKSCPAAWSKRFTQSVPIRITAVDRT